MELVIPVILHQLIVCVIVCAIACAFAVQRSTGFSISLSPAIFSTFPQTEETPALAPSSPSEQNGSVLHPPLALPPLISIPGPKTSKGPVQFFSPSSPAELPNAPQRRAPVNTAPFPAVAPVTSKTQNSPSIHPTMPGTILPSTQHRNVPDGKAPIPEPIASVPSVSPSSAPRGSTDRKIFGAPISQPRNETPKILPPMNPSPNKEYDSPQSSPTTSYYKHRHTRNKIPHHFPASSYTGSSRTPIQQGPVISPHPGNTARQYAPPPLYLGPSSSPSHSSVPLPRIHLPLAPSPSKKAVSGRSKIPFRSPNISPSGSSSRTTPKMPLHPPLQALPPPPPNQDCLTTICTEPYTNTPPGSPCGCVLPMQVGLRLSVALYTFFPLVSELAEEIASGIFVKQGQVRIIGAHAAREQSDKTVILIDLVPMGEKFDNTTAFLTFQRFWHKQVVIKASFFGDYEVLYVHYPGLPPSPPSGISIVDREPYPSNNNNARTMNPLGVDVSNRRHKDGLSGGMIAIIALSSFVVVALCVAAAWTFMFKQKEHAREPKSTRRVLLSSVTEPSGAAGSMMGSRPSSASLSFGSSIAMYGSAKAFSTGEIEQATNNFDPSRILGEGGFGLVYSGVLEDGTQVAVKVLKRHDHQGGREFLAEVEMLSRLHHRNLVKLIGICTEKRFRSLIYELVPNGSVESHLHGVDKEIAPLDWDARMKIALGTARGLAYLHEDSSPRVIHRDFKSSNILLENDFTPKVSDFGLARTAMDEESRHISTRVMGTFGYVAPEYAMTGHLLVKSDVYSYGVVLLELLTGRKPVDMSQPTGQENLVAWARPLLASKQSLESIIDKSLGVNVPFDSIAKVAAIASTCVQPEVSHRPFMGEVVQALKLVCRECCESCDETREVISRGSSVEDLSSLPGQYSRPNYDRGMRLSVSDLLTTSMRFEMQEEFGSFRRHSSSGPLGTVRGRKFWERIRRYSGGNAGGNLSTPRRHSGYN